MQIIILSTSRKEWFSLPHTKNDSIHLMQKMILSTSWKQMILYTSIKELIDVMLSLRKKHK